MVIIKSLKGDKVDIQCLGCALEKKSIKYPLKPVYIGKYFEVHQDYEVPIVGFFVIASKRHVVGFADFNKKENKEFIDILSKVRKGMRDVLKIKYVTFLYRERTIESKKCPSHFHIALLPECSWMEKFSSVSEMLKYSRKNMGAKSNLDKIEDAAKKLKRYLSKK